jgi:plasmid maintenance system antidote protein VapI
MNKQLKAKIIERYGSQADFAHSMRVDESLVSRIIRGRRSLSPEDVKRWSEALGCDPSILEQRQ